MLLPQWLRQLTQRWLSRGGNRRHQGGRFPAPTRLTLEALEDRLALSTITDLTFAGGSGSVATGINATGQVVGYSGTVGGTLHAFLYSNGQMTDLGTLPGGAISAAYGINNAGKVAGVSTISLSTTVTSDYAFLYSNGEMTDLGTLPGGWSSEATGINSAGQVVGGSSKSDEQTHAFLYSNGQMTDLGTLPGGVGSSAKGINDSGQVVGYSDTNDSSGDRIHAFLYSEGQMTDLGTLPGDVNSSASGINNSGQVVGVSWGANVSLHAFLYSNGEMTDLGTLPGGWSSEATGINSAGQVVGHSLTASGSEHAFLYSNGQMIDLNTLLPPNSGWVLTSALGINDKGQIVGYGLHNGASDAFLLDTTTVPDIVMNSVKTSDSKSVTFFYTVNNSDVGQAFDVAIYRSTTDQFNPNDPNFSKDYTEIADTTISANNATEGTHAPVTIKITGGIPPEPSHPFVLAVANPGEKVPETSYQNDSADFRIYTVAVVVPGFGYKATSSPPAWASTMVADLQKFNTQGGAQYDYATTFMWDSGLPYPPSTWNPKYLANAVQILTQKVEALASSYPPDSVVDINLIGHSRGAEVVDEVSQQLQLHHNSLPQQLRDGYLELTLLDPHPANNTLYPNNPKAFEIDGASFSPSLKGMLALYAYTAAQASLNDPPLTIPSNVGYVSEYYQQTPYSSIPLYDPLSILNPWGISPDAIKIANRQDTIFFSLPVVPPVDHSHIQDWFTTNVLPLLYNGPVL